LDLILEFKKLLTCMHYCQLSLYNRFTLSQTLLVGIASLLQPLRKGISQKVVA